MALEHILAAMQAQADAEIQMIGQAANEQSSQIVAEAESRAQDVRSRLLARVQPILAAETAGVKDKATVSAARIMAGERERLIAEAFDAAAGCLGQIRRSPQYRAIFRELAREAVFALGESGREEGTAPDARAGWVAQVDPLDEAIARDTFASLGFRAVVKTVPLPLGGLILAGGDARIEIVNTMEARLKRARETLRGQVARILLGEREREWETTTATPTPA